MKNQIIRIIGLLCLVASFSLSCESRKGDAESTKENVKDSIPRVFVDNYPLYYLTNRIGRDHFQICFPARGDVNPAFWMPDPQSMKALKSADLILLNGEGYARWTQRVHLPEVKTVNTLSEVETAMKIPSAFHSDRWNYNMWLDPVLAKTQAQIIQKSLSDLKPEAQTYFKKQLGLLEGDLDKIIDEGRLKIKAPQGEVVLTNTFEFDYLFNQYNLDVMHFNWNTTSSKQEGEWVRFRTYYQKYHWKRIVCSEMPSPNVLGKLKQYGVEPLLLNSCANVCAGENLLEMMRLNLKKLEQLVKDK